MGGHIHLPRVYLEGQGDLVSRLVIGLISGITWIVWVNNLPTRFPLTLQLVSPEPLTATNGPYGQAHGSRV